MDRCPKCGEFHNRECMGIISPTGERTKNRSHLPECEFKFAPLGSCRCMETMLDRSEARVAGLEAALSHLTETHPEICLCTGCKILRPAR